MSSVLEHGCGLQLPTHARDLRPPGGELWADSAELRRPRRCHSCARAKNCIALASSAHCSDFSQADLWQGFRSRPGGRLVRHGLGRIGGAGLGGDLLRSDRADRTVETLWHPSPRHNKARERANTGEGDEKLMTVRFWPDGHARRRRMDAQLKWVHKNSLRDTMWRREGIL